MNAATRRAATPPDNTVQPPPLPKVGGRTPGRKFDVAVPKHITARANDLSRCYAMVVDGDCMEPEIKSGDLVVVDPTIEPKTGGIVVLFKAELHPQSEVDVIWPYEDGRPIVKRFLGKRGWAYVLEINMPKRQLSMPEFGVAAMHVVIGTVPPSNRLPAKRLAGRTP